MEILCFAALAVLLTCGAWRICAAVLFHDRSTVGRHELEQLVRQGKGKREPWDGPLAKWVTSLFAKAVYLDETARNDLQRQLQRAGIDVSPEEITARKYVVAAITAVLALVCSAFQAWVGVILCVLVGIYGVMNQRETITSRIQARDEAIAMEMPRFVRTICRTLRNDRDIYAALASYYKVAGPVLSQELDILLYHMRSGGVPMALQQFQQRLGTETAFRLCSTLQDIDRGIDQTGTLEFLADDMAQAHKLSVQKTLSTRPGRMRATYLPAVAVCVVMILYVLIVFVTQQITNLY